VNNGEDKPKVFPQEIMPLEDAPKKFTKQVHFRLDMRELSMERVEMARNLAAAHPGKCPLFLCFKKPGGESLFIETHEKYSVLPSRKLQEAVVSVFGDEAYHVRTDNTLPEKVKRWEKRNGNGDGD
jgi:hypothetical protein